MTDPNRNIYTIESRCFAPFEEFGGGFRGDMRGFGTSELGSSRIHSSVDVWPGMSTASAVKAYSDPTHGPNVHLGLPTASVSNPTGTINAQQIQGGTEYKVHVQGSNPLLPAPDIDNRATIALSQEKGVLSVIGAFSGDKFPASEWTLRDSGSQAIFMCGYMPTNKSEVWTKLWGDNERPTGSLDMKISLDKNGNFDKIVSAELKDPDGKVICAAKNATLTEWNQKVMRELTPPGMPAPEKPPPERSNLGIQKGGFDR